MEDQAGAEVQRNVQPCTADSERECATTQPPAKRSGPVPTAAWYDSTSARCPSLFPCPTISPLYTATPASAKRVKTGKGGVVEGRRADRRQAEEPDGFEAPASSAAC